MPGSGRCFRQVPSRQVPALQWLAGAGSTPFASDRDLLDSRQLGLGGSFLFALLIWLSAVAHIPHDPAPYTFQTLGIALAALALGPRYGSLSVLLYLVAIGLGVPAAAEQEGGWRVYLGGTSGYLIGFLPAQFVICWIVRTRDSGGAIKLRAWWALPLGVLVGDLTIFAFGVPVLWLVRNLDPSTAESTRSFLWAFEHGFVNYAWWELTKVSVAAVLGGWLVPHAARRGW